MNGEHFNQNEPPTTDQAIFPPGPYIVTGPNGRLNQIGIGREAGPNGYVDPIGVAYGAGRQVEAIANLFAAAPDLLQALKEVIALSDRKHDAWDAAHAAIAKAECRS